MYRCDNPKCRAEFEEPATYKEYHNEIEGGFYEELPCCPYCGCEDYNEIDEEPDEIEDDENEIESFEFMVVVRYDSLQGYYRNAYFYASNKEDANEIVGKFLKKGRTKLCRVYKLIDAEVDNE